MLKYLQKFIGAIALLALLWTSQGYSFEVKQEGWTTGPAEMWAYWLLFLVPAGLALNPIKLSKNINHILWTMVSVLFILLIGLRYFVGTDFDNYLTYYEQSISELKGYFTGESGINIYLAYGNASGYMVLNAFAQRLGIWGNHGIYVVNTFCATLFVIGLVKFCRKQPLPWVALAVSVPFMVCAVAMGYTRQSAALGCLMWGWSLLRPGNEYKYVALVLFGSTFHLSVIAALPFVLITRESIPKILYLIGGLIIAYMTYVLATIDLGNLTGTNTSVENLAVIFQYTATRGSPGGPIRTYMNALPVLVAFLYWNRIKTMSIDTDIKLIKWIAIATFMCLPALLYSTTLTDRMGLYLMPIQLALWPRIIAAQKTQLLRSTFASSVLSFYCLVLYVFFHFGNHSHFWLPYLMYPFTSEPIYLHPVPMDG